MRYKNIAGRFFGLVTKHACDRQTDGRTENYDCQDRASILRRAVKTKSLRWHKWACSDSGTLISDGRVNSDLEKLLRI